MLFNMPKITSFVSSEGFNQVCLSAKSAFYYNKTALYQHMDKKVGDHSSQIQNR